MNANQGPLPWYRKDSEDIPFVLAKVIGPSKAEPGYRAVSIFPWSQRDYPNDAPLWLEWVDSIAFSSKSTVWVIRQDGYKYAARVDVDIDTGRGEITSIAWALTPTRDKPLLVIASGSLIYILDIIARTQRGVIRGHGDIITSICVWPSKPHMFATTSKDFSIRIHDVSLPPPNIRNNPHWPPHTTPSASGPSHGLRMSAEEGIGLGACVAVLRGSRSGGHAASVLCASFHPTLPLLATCGIDRAIKIWKIPDDLTGQVLMSEDKPLFSSRKIHRGAVLSVAWLSEDELISHSAETLMRITPGDRDDIYDEEGTVAIWQWLSLRRFFPLDKEWVGKPMIGCSSDWEESASFTILIAYSLPMGQREMTLYRSATHDPVLLFPNGTDIRVVHMRHLAENALSAQDEDTSIDDGDEEAISAFLQRVKKYYKDDDDILAHDHRKPPIELPFDKGWALISGLDMDKPDKETDKTDEETDKIDRAIVSPIRKVKMGCEGSLIVVARLDGLFLYGIPPRRTLSNQI